jgi:hypothetical protein
MPSLLSPFLNPNEIKAFSGSFFGFWEVSRGGCPPTKAPTEKSAKMEQFYDILAMAEETLRRNIRKGMEATMTSHYEECTVAGCDFCKNQTSPGCWRCTRQPEGDPFDYPKWIPPKVPLQGYSFVRYTSGCDHCPCLYLSAEEYTTPWGHRSLDHRKCCKCGQICKVPLVERV